MHIGILAARTASSVNGELKHGESVLHNVFPKQSIALPLLLGFGRKVEKYKYPHNSILV
jgi:hypothetical protein